MTPTSPAPASPAVKARRGRRAQSLAMHGAIMHATMADAATAAGRGNYRHARHLLGEVRVYLEAAERAVDGWMGEET